MPADPSSFDDTPLAVFDKNKTPVKVPKIEKSPCSGKSIVLVRTKGKFLWSGNTTTSTTTTSITTSTTSTSISTTSTTIPICAVKGDQTPCDGLIDDWELLDYIKLWAQGFVLDFDRLEAIKNWAEI